MNILSIRKNQSVKSESRLVQLRKMLPMLSLMELSRLAQHGDEIEFLHDNLDLVNQLRANGFIVYILSLDMNPNHICELTIEGRRDFGLNPMFYEMYMRTHLPHIERRRSDQICYYGGTVLVPTFIQAHKMQRELRMQGFSSEISRLKGTL